LRARISRHLFRAAVVSAPVVDVISHAGTSDSGW
jgi:dipeptidyl aminopeptidase/acylaminoacyl peptidase